MDEWDISITRQNKNGVRQISLPVSVSRALNDKGFNRAILRLTSDGILIVPYVGRKKTPQKATVVLPFLKEG